MLADVVAIEVDVNEIVVEILPTDVVAIEEVVVEVEPEDLHWSQPLTDSQV